jgi:hypothetical protein
MEASPSSGEVVFLRSTVQALRIMVGVVFAATVFDNLHHHNYGSQGYRRLINGYLEHGNQPSFQRSIMRLVRDHASVAGPLQEVTEIAIAVALLAGIAVPLFSLIAALLLAGLGVSEFAVGWAWELWPLALMAALVLFASLPAVRSRGLRALIGERPDAGGLLDPLGVVGRLALAAATGALVLWILHQNRQPASTTTRAAASVGLLLAANIVLDRVAARRIQRL